MRTTIPTGALALAAASTLAIAATVNIVQERATEGTAGCGVSHIFPGLTQYYSLQSSGVDRSYSVHIPSNYNDTAPYPVVLGFHGSSEIGFFFEADTGLSESKYSADKIMVYPNGLGGAWAGANYSEATVPEDLQFVSDLLDAVRAGWCIDNSRIYATGMSIGGGFVNTIACSAVGGEFAAFAASSGSFYTDATGPDDGCTPARSPLPMLEIHGGADTDVHYEGGPGEGGIEPAIPDWLGWWAERNSCGTNTSETLFNGDVQHYTWECSGVADLLQHWKVDDMKHCWASTTLDFFRNRGRSGPHTH
ncbi:Carbohydrate esterase family 1 protein [Mycena sanguinolenta]|uniref:feruloyl esterase n=1 Tax=Mycena sanguinolenta TaxID=230812 RepID=A0A8H7CJ57_9AGAR|nr:Carbohydrate esterase family 1 protein [Mycena sanguinolenta]